MRDPRVDDPDERISETGQSTADGGIDEIVARQAELGQTDLPAEGEEGSSEGAVPSAG
ncbi:MAG TPA: hypothetical protein VEG38_12025 [Acidimicrobiia bacterium]|nr:hypothetical protein [Acidimicrobiia bacterium]